MVIVSAPGKVHLMGEHAVVYGKPALLAAIDLRMRVTIEEHAGQREPIRIYSAEPTEYARFAVDFLLTRLHISPHAPVTITINSDIPAGYHLGSSAAVAVALSGALLYFFKKLWNPMKINELAYEIEKKQHGNPSGGDNTTVTVGGFVWYRKELEFLKSIWQLPFKPHASLNHFFLINTGKPKETTGEMVAFVRSLFMVHSSQYEEIFNENEKQVKRITTALRDGREEELIDAIRIGEKTLEHMGVVSKKVTPLIRAIEQAGGAVKILGGGGKTDGVGFILCYHHTPKQIETLTKPLGYGIQTVCLGEEGVRLDER